MTSRRNFLKNSGLALAALAIAPACVTSSGAAVAKKPLGIQLYTLRDYIKGNVDGVLGKIAKAGYTQVETYGLNNGKYWGMETKAFKQLISSHGLTTPSGHYGIDQFLSAQGTDADLAPSIESATILGQEYVTVPYLPENLRGSADAYRQLANRLNRAGELCKAAKLKLAYHNHDFEFVQFGNETGYDILLKNTSPALVDFELDLYWTVRGQKSPVAMFQQHPGRFKLWHVKDMAKGNTKSTTEVGNGSINFKEIFAAGKKAGVQHLFVEQENFDMDAFESIGKSYAYVQKELM